MGEHTGIEEATALPVRPVWYGLLQTVCLGDLYGLAELDKYLERVPDSCRTGSCCSADSKGKEAEEAESGASYTFYRGRFVRQL